MQTDNRTDIVAGNQHWGHATSQDLYHWENQQIALFPPTADSGIFSGSAVIDVNNTSGFFPEQDDGVVAIYTLNTPAKQVQNIAYTFDGGFTFTTYEANPAIDSASTQFRDPKVIWYEAGQYWVMAVAYAQDFVIGIFTSPNLKDWTHASNFSNPDVGGDQWECPNLVEMPADGGETTYLLTISITSGAPLGGSITKYLAGRFDGTAFTPAGGPPRLGDFAKDNYAGQFFYGTPAGSDAISIAWASNWQYTQVVPTGDEGWRSVMSLPRRNYLANNYRVGWTLVSLPYDLSPVIGSELGSNDSLANASLVVDYSSVASNAIYFEVNVTGLPSSVSDISSSATLNFTALSPVSGESVSGGYFFGGDNPFWLNRGKTRGFDNPFFTDKFSTAQLLGTKGTWSLSGVIDRSIIELFLDQGASSATATFFPVEPLSIFAVGTAGLPEGAQVSVAVWGLESAWAQYENENGTVVGNVTTSSSSVEKRMLDEGSFEA